MSSANTIVVRGPADRSTFALTYDDGPEWPGTDQRAPYGHFVPETVLEAERRGWTCVLWSTLGEDWHADESAATIAGRVVADLAPGAIVLLHDAQRYAHERDDCAPTIEASELVLDEAKRVASKR